MSDSVTPRPGGDEALRAAVTAIRRHWRTRSVLEGAPVLVGAALVALLAGVALRAAFGAPATVNLATRVIGYALLALVALWFIVRPWRRRVSDQVIALYVEEQAPELRQLFLSAVHHPDEPAAAGASPALQQMIVDRAVAELQRLENGAAIERPKRRQALGRLAALAAAFVAMIAFGPTMLRDVARVLFVPWAHAAAAPVPALSVAPGDISVPRGAALDLRAELRATVDHGAELVMRADSADNWTRIPMVHDSTGSGYVARVFDINRNTVYYVEGGGMRSPRYHITVTDLPTVKVLSLTLHYPAYTGLPVQKIDNGGDVVAVSGTAVVVDVTPTLPVAGGSLRFDDGTTTPLSRTADGRLTGSFKIAHDGFYRVDMLASDGAKVPGTVQHSIEVLADHPPTIRIEKPGRDTRVSSIEEVAVAVRASDDYGVHDVALHVSINGGPDKVIALSDSSRKASLDFSAVHTLFLEELALHVGDLVAYHATARDGAGHGASSDIYFMEVRPFGKDYHSADDNGGGGGGGGGSPPGKFTERERNIVAGTFNWQRDSAATPDRDRRANATTLAISQGKLRADVTAQAAQMASRGVARDDSAFVVVMAELDSAARAMKPAEDGLGRFVMSDAIPAEERALQHLQAADEAYRDVTVRQQQGGGGGGGGGGSAPQDLADLFELQTDKLKNQYETPRADASGTPQQQAIDSTAERLQQLAARQQAENERAQRAAEAMQSRLPAQQGGGGGGGGQQGQPAQPGQGGRPQSQQLARPPAGGGPSGSAQRELARQAEEQARQLERLSREQQSPELADAAQKLQQAADAMRQAAAGSPQQGNAALDRLRQATQNLNGAASAAQGQAIQDLAQRANALGQQQQAIARDVADPTGAARQRAQLEQRKDDLARGVQQLADDAQRVAQQVRREQPKAAAAAQTAADEIRGRQLADEINYSKRLIGDSSMAGSSRNLESQIRETIDSVAQRLSVAAGGVAPPRDQQQTLALDRTRDLVNELQSLRDRTTGEEGQGAGQQQGQRAAAGQAGQPGGEPGQRGQQGQRSQQGEGQRGQGQRGQGQGQGEGQRGQGQGQGQGQGGQGRQGTGRQDGGRAGGGMAPPNGQFTPGGIGDPRQFRGEVAARQQAAEQLRRDLAAQGVDVRPLDLTIEQLKQLQQTTNPGRADELQAAVIAGLKEFEFGVWRKFHGLDLGARPALGAAAQVPPEYRALVEEYYRSLARKGPS